VLYDHFY